MIRTLGALALFLGIFSVAQAADYSTNAKKEVIGVGINIDTTDGKVMIMGIIANSPAERSGLLMANDQILAVRQLPTTEYVALDATNVDAVLGLIKGDEGTTVGLRVLRGTDTKEFEIVRGKFEVDDGQP